jgi:hypothetical protein
MPPVINIAIRPHLVHSGGKVVDDFAATGPKLVDNPVGAGRPAP